MGYTRKLIFLICGVLALGLLINGVACNEHPLKPFQESVKASTDLNDENAGKRPVDILFVIDDSNSMADEQSGLNENFDKMVEALLDAKADFRLAVVSTSPGLLYSNGYDSSLFLEYAFFNTEPNVSGGGGIGVDSAECKKYFSTYKRPWMEKGDELLKGADGNIDKSLVQKYFKCMAYTGITGNPVEQGIKTAIKSLTATQPSQLNCGHSSDSRCEGIINNRKGWTSQSEFKREGSILSIVFVTDENDCSLEDGQISKGDLPLCEHERNIEDSCTFGKQQRYDKSSLVFTPKSLANDENIGYCIMGNREKLKDLGSEFVNCPDEGCKNKLMPRINAYNTLINFLLEKNAKVYENVKAEGNLNLEEARRAAARSDIIIALIGNRDRDGERIGLEQRQFEFYCGQGERSGYVSYRYQLFAQMFDDPIIAPICCNEVVSGICNSPDETVSQFGQVLSAIGDRIGKAINSVCLPGAPLTCDYEACKDTKGCGGCKGKCKSDIYFKSDPERSYSVCEDFAVVVAGEDKKTKVKTILEEGKDYVLNMESRRCMAATGSPMEIKFNSSGNAKIEGRRLTISYPRKVSTK